MSYTRDLIYDFVTSIGNNFVAYIPSNTLRCFIYSAFFKMRIGSGTRIGLGVKILAPWKISIGKNSIVNSGCLLDGRSGLSIGNNVDIAWDTFILTLQHDFDDPDYRAVGSPVVIWDRVCITTRSLILPGVTIGEGAVVGAGAIVTKDVPAYVIVVGAPAKIIRTRKKDFRYKLRGRKFQ